MPGSAKTKSRNERRRKARQANATNGGGPKSRASARREALQATRAALGGLYAPELIGKGAYDFRKAFNGKNAARKRQNTLRRMVDIGGRSVGALSQAAAGDYLGAMMSGLKILGKGDYSLSRNSVVDDMTANTVPVMHSSKESIRFRHREFICDIYSGANTNFQIQRYALNPGVSYTFPFLATIAQQFQQYRFMGLAFEFKSTSAVAIANANQIGMGTVMMAAQYRANAPVFTNKQTMMNEMWSVDGRPSDCFMLPIECAPSETPMDCLYVRGSSLAATAAVSDDIKFYDLAVVSIATQGIPVPNQIIGELWITYDVEFFKPQPTNNVGLYEPVTQITWSGATAAYPFGNFTAAQYITSALVDTIGFNLPSTSTGAVLIQNTSVGAISPFSNPTWIYFPLGLVGTFQVTLFWNGVSTTTAWAPPGATNCSLVRSQIGATGAASLTLLADVWVNIPSPSVQASISLSLTPPASSTNNYMMISQVNPLVV